MEGRCAAESLAEFGVFVRCGSALIRRGSGSDVFICTGAEEVFVFAAQEKTLRAVLLLPAAVTDLAVSRDDEQLLFVACRSGVYCVSLQLLAHSDAGSGPAELKVSSEFLVVAGGGGGAPSLLLVGSLLLTVCRTDASWTVNLYRAPPQPHPRPWDLLSSASLPLGPPPAPGGAESKPVPVCVYVGEATPPTSSPSSSHVPLQPALFELLFGAEAALCRSPVLLCGLPDGRLVFLPLRLPGSRLRVLHGLEQPLAFIGASAAVETGAGGAGCLVALGKHGGALLIRAGSEGGGAVAAFTEGCVPGPVECACVDRRRLYYSTGSELLALDLSAASGGGGAERPGAAALHRPVALNVGGVAALDPPTCGPAGGVELLSLSVRGQLQRLRLPVRRQQDGPPKLLPPQVGRSVGDFLSAIGDVCERASVQKSAIRSKQRLLKQLNQAVNIGFLLTSRSAGEEKPIRCVAAARWSRLLQQDSLHLTCVLQNGSRFALRRGWTLSVAVRPLSGRPSSSAAHSFPFGRLRPGESLEACVPVATAGGGASFPVTVTCSLVFSLPSLLGAEAAPGGADSPSGRFCLPVDTLTVDWLHALRLVGPASTQTPAAAADAVQALVNSRRRTGTEAGEASGAEEHSARVRVSSELLRAALRLQRPDPEQTGSRAPPRDACVSLLQWLLSAGCGGVKAEPKGDGSGSAVCGRAPNDATVKLTAKQVSLEEDGEEESLVCVEVQVQSRSLAAVCGLHHAVLRRLQTLLQIGSSSNAPISALRRALRPAESLRGEICAALSADASCGRTPRSLLRVYLQLRDAPLLLV